MERYHIFKLGLAIIFYAAYCIRPMLVHGLRSNDLEQNKRTQQALKSEDYLVYYQGADGIPGVDFPVLSNIPRTGFSCKGIDSGYYADLDTDCQVFHICEEGKKISFLCPNGTIFEQSDLICEWWYKVNCTNSPNLYAESAEQLKEDLAKSKASRRVYLDGHERNHGAVMRTEETASVSAKQNGKQIGKNRVNAAAKKQQFRGHDRNISNPPQRAININIEEQEKPKRFNDAETGNYINNFNKQEANKNFKEYHLQFSDSTSASTAKSIFTRSTTPSSVPSFTVNDDAYTKPVNRNRGTVRFGDVSVGSTLRPTDDYTLPDFPTHKSESANTPRSKTFPKGSTSKQKSTVALTKNDIANRKLEPESEELQVPQETAAFASSSYNGIRKSSRKFLTSPHPNHRAVYSDLKQPSVSSPKIVNPINSVTPQYITTQSINNGKPFIGSTVGGKVVKGSKGSFAAASTVSPLSTTYLPPFEDSSRLTTILLENTTKKILDYATVYGTFSKRPATTPIPPNLVEVKFDKNQDKIGIQLGTSVVGGGTPKYSSAVVPPLLTTDAFVKIEDTQSTPSFANAKDVQISTQGSGSVFISGRGRPSISDGATKLRVPSSTETSRPQSANGFTKYSSAVVPPLVTSDAFVHVGDGQSTLVTTRGQSPTPGFAEGSTSGTLLSNSFISNQPIDGTVTFKGDATPRSQSAQGSPKYSSAVVPPLLTPDAFVRTSDIESITSSAVSFVDTTSTRGRSRGTFDRTTTEGFYQTTTENAVVPDTSKSQIVKGILKYSSAVVPPLITSDAFIHGEFEGTPGITAGGFATGFGVRVNPSTGKSYLESTTPLTDTQTFEKGITTDAFTGSGATATGTIRNIGSSDTENIPASTKTQSFEAGTTKSQFTEGNLKYSSAVIPPLITSDAFVHGDFQGTTNIGTNSAVEGSGTGFSRTTGHYESTTPLSNTQTIEEEKALKSQAIDSNLKYGSAVVPPLITSDAFVHGEFQGTTGAGIEFGRTVSQTTDGTYYQSTTPLPNTQTLTEGESQSFGGNSKYASAVVPPLLTSDAFVHSTGYQGTTGSVANQNQASFDKTDTQTTEITGSTQTFRESTSPNPQDAFVHTGDFRSATNAVVSLPKTTIPKQITVDVSQNNIASTLAPESERITTPKIAEENPKYSSAVTPASLTPDTVIHVSDFQRTPSGSLVIGPGKNVSFITLDEATVQSTTGPLSITETGKYASAITNGSDTSSNSFRPNFFPTRGGQPSKTLETPTSISSSQARGNTKYSSPVVPPLLTPDAFVHVSSAQNSVTPTPFAEEGSATTSSGFYLTKNAASASTISMSTGITPEVNINLYSGQNDVKPPQLTLSTPKFDDSSLVKAESKWPRPFQKSPNSLGTEDLKTEPVTPTYFTYKISSARPFQLPEDSTPTPTLPTPFTTAATQTSSVYENVDNMINILKEIANVGEKDFSSETPRPGLVVPPSVGPETLHSLAVYFANALDGISAERANATGEELLDNDSKEKLTSLLTQMTMYRYKELFKGKNTEDVPPTTTEAVDDSEEDSANEIDPPALRNLARNFTLALSSYLNDPDAFRKELVSLRPTEPPPASEDNVDLGVGEEELLNFSDADTKSSFPPVFPTLPSVKPTWGFIIAGQSPNDLDVKNSLNPDLHTADTQSFVPGFNNLAVDTGKSTKGFSKPNLPGDHWTTSSGATKLWQSAFSVNPEVVNEEFKTTEPLPSTTEAYITAPESSEALSLPQSEIQYDLRTLPKIKLNSTQVHGILIDFMNTTKTDESNRLQRLLKKLNTSEDEFLNRMKEIESNPLTRRLILLLISECAVDATKDLTSHSINTLSKELLESSSSNSAVTSHNEGRQIANSFIPELVDPKLQQDDQDTRALQLLNSLYTIASRFGK